MTRSVANASHRLEIETAAERFDSAIKSSRQPV